MDLKHANKTDLGINERPSPNVMPTRIRGYDKKPLPDSFLKAKGSQPRAGGEGFRLGAGEELAKSEQQTHICGIAHLFNVCHARCMSRISIDISDEEHRKLKAMAALKGQSLKDFLLQRTLGEETQSDEEAALVELVALLDARLQRAEKEGTSPRTVGEIFRQVRREAKAGKNG